VNRIRGIAVVVGAKWHGLEVGCPDPMTGNMVTLCRPAADDATQLCDHAQVFTLGFVGCAFHQIT